MTVIVIPLDLKLLIFVQTSLSNSLGRMKIPTESVLEVDGWTQTITKMKI